MKYVFLGFIFLFNLYSLLDFTFCIETFKIHFYHSVDRNNNPLLLKLINENSTYKEINEMNYLKSFEYYYNHNLITPLCIGTPKQCFNIELTFKRDHSWLCVNYGLYNNKKSTSYENFEKSRKICTKNNIIQSSFYGRDLFKLDHNIIQSIKFFSTYEYKCRSGFGELGFGKVFDNFGENEEEDSIVSQLKKKKVIESTTIGLKYINSTYGELILGNDYSRIAKHSSRYLELPMKEDSITTTSKFKSIYIVNSIISKRQKQEKKVQLFSPLELNVQFDFNSYFIKFPYELLEQIKNITFSKYISNSICKIEYNIKLKVHYIVCEESILNTKLDSLVIEFKNNKKIQINFSKLFLSYYDNSKKSKLIFGIIFEKSLKYIFIGEVYLNYLCTFLDREKNIIRFYFKESLVNDSDEENLGMIGILIITLIIIFFLVHLFYKLFHKDKPSLRNSQGGEKLLHKPKKNYLLKENYAHFKSSKNLSDSC